MESGPLQSFGDGLRAGRHDPHIGVDGIFSPFAGHQVQGKNPGQLLLGGWTHVLDVVQENRSFVAAFNEARSRGLAVFHAPEFGFQGFGGHHPAVDADEAPVLSLAEAVDGPGHDFLARSVLSDDQHVAFDHSRVGDFLFQGLHGACSADQPVGIPVVELVFRNDQVKGVGVAFGSGRFFFRKPVDGSVFLLSWRFFLAGIGKENGLVRLVHFPDKRPEKTHVVFFEIGGVKGVGSLAHFLVAVAGEKDRLDVRLDLPKPGDGFQAVDFRHMEIHNGQIHMVGLTHVQGFGARHGFEGDEPHEFDTLGKRIEKTFLVVDDQNFFPAEIHFNFLLLCRLVSRFDAVPQKNRKSVTITIATQIVMDKGSTANGTLRREFSGIRSSFGREMVPWMRLSSRTN